MKKTFLHPRSNTPNLIPKRGNIFDHILDNLVDVIWILDIESLKYIYISHGIKDLRGYTYNEALEQHLSESLTQSSYNDFINLIREDLPKNKDEDTQNIFFLDEVQQLHKDGSIIYTEVTCKIIKSDDGKLELHGATRDISKRKHAELGLIQKENEMRELLKTNNQIISTLSHDLRGPLGNLNELIKLVIDNFDIYDKNILKKLLHSVSVTTNNTFQIMDNLVAWAKIHRENIPYDIRETNLYTITNEELDIYFPMIKNKSIRINNLIPKEFVANCNKESVSIVFRNLISNALKFTEPGGEITITGSQTNERIEVNVKDSGVGIPEHIQDKILKTSVNVCKPGTNNEMGTGLGLLLSKELIEKNNGQIWFKSKEGQGTCFSFSLRKN